MTNALMCVCVCVCVFFLIHYSGFTIVISSKCSFKLNSNLFVIYLASTYVGSICYKMTCLVAIIIGKPKKPTLTEIERGEILTSLD